jgi:hypothetical protein
MQQNKNTVFPGTLNLMILKALETLEPLHGYMLRQNYPRHRESRPQQFDFNLKDSDQHAELESRR